MKKKIFWLMVIACMIMELLSIITVNATQDRSYNFNKNYTLTGNYANDIVAVANAQLWKSQSNLGYTEAWCADFATDCARLTGMPDNIVPYNYSSRGGCVYLYNYMINNCNAQVVSDRQPGDFVFYYCPSCGTYPHVGIVLDGTYSAEGNVNGQVYKIGGSNQYIDSNGHKVSSGQIQRIYVRPNYGSGALTPVDLGTDFYTYILNQPCWKPIACETDGTNVYLEQDKWTANQRWFAHRNSDGSYTFKNAANNKCLDVDGGADSNNANVQVYTENGSDAQKWFVYYINNQYIFQPKCSSDKVLDLSNAGTSDGTNVQLYTKNGSDAQSFNIYKVDCKAEKPEIEADYKDIYDYGSVTISWESIDYTDHYDYYLTEYPEGFGYVTNTTKGSTNNTFVEFSNLKSGRYSCFIHAISHQGGWSDQSNWVTFNVYADDYIPISTIISDNHLYALYDYEMSWSFARDLCKDLGGNLVTVTSTKENQVITDLIKSGAKDAYWLGATDGVYGTEKDFQWVTGENFSYSNWMSGEPSSSGTDGEKEHFIEIRKSYGSKWNDVNNISKTNKGFILEVDLSEVSPIAEEIYNGNKYLLFDKNTTWTEAKIICEQYGGHLVTIENTNENTFVKRFLKNGERAWYYLGGQKSNDIWRWIDGGDVSSISWADNYTAAWSGNNLMMYKSSGDCIGLHNAYYPESDIKNIGFVCEIENSIISPTPTNSPAIESLPINTKINTNVMLDNSQLSNTVTVNLTNTSEQNIDGDIIFVYRYENGNIAKINIQPTTILSSGTQNVADTIITKITELNNNLIKSVDVYVWDSVKGMKPLAEKAVGYFKYE